MPIIFYDHLISKSEVVNLIASLEEAENQKNKLLQLVDDIVYQGIILMILNKLSESKHSIFLEMVNERPYDIEILLFLREHAHPEIETHISEEGQKLLGMIIKDMLI
jgi:hypothetical protein